MNTKHFLKTVGMAGILSVAATSYAAAYIDQVDKFTCVLSLHDQCFGNGETNCTQEDYQEAVDGCDDVDWEATPTIDAKRLIQTLKTVQKKRGGQIQLKQ